MAERSNKSNVVDEDLISKLPDEILTHILSYVNTNSAVATSILSKRWQLVWTLVTNLEFEYNSSQFNLQNLVDRVLSLNNVTSVRNVKLDCSGCDNLCATAWFKSLAMRKAEKFHLNLPNSFLAKDIGSLENLNLLPDRFFNQKNLVELELTNVVLKVPPSVYFPRLKTISLKCVQLLEDESMKNLLSGCPAITDLHLLSEEWFEDQTLYVCSSTLQNLQIRTFSDEIVIDAPNVRYLCLNDKTGASYGIINLPSLVKASLINISDTKLLYRILGKISHVKKLVLDEYTTMALGRSSPEKIGMLHYLTHLKLSGIECPKN